MKKKAAILLLAILLCRLTPLSSNPQTSHTKLVASGASVAIPYSPSHITRHANTQKEIFTWFRTLSEVIHLVAQRHYKKIDIPTLIQDALKAAIPKTDPHSSFFSQKSYKAAIESTSGKFSGIGVSIMNKAPEDDALIIIEVIPRGPSAKAGLEAGDKIIAVEGETLKGLSSDEVINKLRGKVGTKINLKIMRKKKPLEFTIERAVIKDQNLQAYNFKNQNIYYVSLKMFADNTPNQMAKILKQVEKKSANGLIIDLRRNPGGVLESAVDMVGLFQPKGSLVVSTKNQSQAVVKKYYTNKRPVFTKKIPVTLLIDNFTASASEIFSGCLKHYAQKNDDSLTFVVGTESFGKGSVQEVIPISNGCALKLTTMTYFLPDDTPIQAKGVTPDITITRKINPKKTAWFHELYGKESALKNHIPARGEEEKKKKEKTTKKAALDDKNASKEEIAKNWEPRYKKALKEDSQIQACLNMIAMLNSAKKNKPHLVKSRKLALAFLKKHYVTEDGLELEKID